MTEQARFIATLESVDVNQTDWDYVVIESVVDKYAKGYLSARRSTMNDLGVSGDDMRLELIKVASWNIWGK